MILVFSFTAFAGLAQEIPNFKVLEPVQYKQEVSKDSLQLVDVRTPEEYVEGHIEGAENIDFLAEGFFSEMEKFDKKKPLYIYCRSGNRSAKAAATLSEMGFNNIIDLKGGYNAWKDLEEE